MQSHLNLVQQQISEFKENFNKLSNIPNQVEVLKNHMKTFEENSAAKNKSVTPPTPKPREKSPGVLKNDIDDLKTAFTDAQLGKKSGRRAIFTYGLHFIFNIISNFFSGHKRLKKSFENYKKDVETELKKVRDNAEQNSEQILGKITNVETNSQDLNSKIGQLKSNLSKLIHFQIIIN